MEAARTLGKVGTKCCALPEAQRMPCVEDYVSLFKDNKVVGAGLLSLDPDKPNFHERGVLICASVCVVCGSWSTIST